MWRKLWPGSNRAHANARSVRRKRESAPQIPPQLHSTDPYSDIWVGRAAESRHPRLTGANGTWREVISVTFAH